MCVCVVCYVHGVYMYVNVLMCGCVLYDMYMVYACALYDVFILYACMWCMTCPLCTRVVWVHGVCIHVNMIMRRCVV